MDSFAILAVSPDASDYSASTEMFTSFYDIFVRNAFRNYKDVLREVSYSPIMAEMRKLKMYRAMYKYTNCNLSL